MLRAMTSLPETDTLLLALRDNVLHVTFNRPERRNALSPRMVDDLLAVFAAVQANTELCAIVLRGAQGTFCAGADVKEMAAARAKEPAGDPGLAIARSNRRFGELASVVRAATQPVVAVVEGAVMGGGFGLVCASDVALALRTAFFALPETGLGLVPAQIAPFVVERVGLTHARRLMLTGARIDGAEAARLGLVHEVCDDVAALELSLARVLTDIRRCAPRANAATKRLVLSVPGRELAPLLDEAATVFAAASLGDEAREGITAFAQKRLPHWAK
jgi:isohexenylglutaconyl-CoA hydratase